MQKNRLYKTLTIICLTYMTAAMIIMPHKAISAAREALSLCGSVIVPSLFPFIFCAEMFISLGAASIVGKYLSPVMRPLFKLPGAASAAFVLGITSGYPIGAVCASSLYRNGDCTKEEAERVLAFCNNSGPMFIIGAVGSGMLKNHTLGLIIYIIHMLSAVLTGIILGIFSHSNKNSTRRLCSANYDASIKDSAANLGDAVSKSVNSIIKVCGFVLVFAVFCATLPETNIKPYLYPFFEITGGIDALLRNKNIYTIPLASAFLSFSGMSVLSQTATVVASSGLSLKTYVKGKLIQSFLSFIMTLGVIKVFPLYTSTFTSITKMPSSNELTANSLTMITYIIFGFIIISALSKHKNKIK